MKSLEIATIFRESACGQIALLRDGVDKFIVETPFMFDDGDHFVVVLKKIGEHWVFTDEGHTFMHLSYGGFKITPARKLLIDGIVRIANGSHFEGELTLKVLNKDFGFALFGFGQMLTKIAEVAKWTREHVRSTFIEDFQGLIEGVVPPSRLSFDYTDAAFDPEQKYVVDCKVNGMPRPLFIFAIGSNFKCKDVTIAIHRFRSWNIEFDSMAIFEDQTHIARNTLAKLSDIVGKQFSSIGPKKEIAEYLESHIPGLSKQGTSEPMVH